MPKPSTVAGYIASAPRELRPKLREMRALIRAAAPDAVEKIGYGMPYFAHFKDHISLFLPTPTVGQHARELKGYVTSRGTIQFPHERKLPKALIRKLVRARVRRNESR